MNIPEEPLVADARPPRTQDIRALVAGVLAFVSLLGTITVIIIGLLSDVDATLAAATLGGFTTTFGAYALGIQSEARA